MLEESDEETTVVIIPKSGKNKFIPMTHCPVYLLKTMAKLFKTLILKGLKKTISPFIRLRKFAFRPRYSTTIQLIKLVDELAIFFNRKERIVAVILHFEKSFDKVRHCELLVKMI